MITKNEIKLLGVWSDVDKNINAKPKKFVELSVVLRLKQELKDILCTEKYCESGREKHQCPNCFCIEKVFGVEGEK